MGYCVHKAVVAVAVVQGMAAVRDIVVVQDILVGAVDQDTMVQVVDLGMANQKCKAVGPAAGPGRAS
jgi:hypothetical protein